MAQARPYRKCAGSVIFNALGKVLAGERYPSGKQPPGMWQFPQGGVESGETVEQAALRETQEEFGIPSEQLRIVHSIVEPIKYDFPPDIDTPITRKYCGQAMFWSLLFWNGSPEECKLDHLDPGHDYPEFSQVAWVDW
eukprot:CAMPEP_0184647474 /NCGR_PEP_ID=MMETSP0308-20130426/4421_1 /TAXON_ID=38269 /ORGANISM="Gloeochaete witrockiana, Strain SAG 46.84" /LENGTH=137 /DNA_ID=CAMNT_0027078475 /DNA_START=124 /DNA_END=534 /DNA_ORIENTATION=-